MIWSVRGEVLAIGLDHAVVEVGGVGLAVQATPEHARRGCAAASRPGSPPRSSSARTR